MTRTTSTLGEATTDAQAAVPLVARRLADSPRTTPVASPNVGGTRFARDTSLDKRRVNDCARRIRQIVATYDDAVILAAEYACHTADHHTARVRAERALREATS